MKLKLSSMVIDLRSGSVHCSAESNENGVSTNVSFTIQESVLISKAQFDGRYTWDNSDVLKVASECSEIQISDL